MLGPGEFFQGLALGSKLFVEGSVGKKNRRLLLVILSTITVT